MTSASRDGHRDFFAVWPHVLPDRWTWPGNDPCAIAVATLLTLALSGRFLPPCPLFVSSATFCSIACCLAIRHRCEVPMAGSTETWPQLDVIAVGAHPDDV